MNIAFVHDWIVTSGGAERTLAHLHKIWPDAPVYTLLTNPAVARRLLPQATIITSGLQRLPLSWRYYPQLAPFMPSAIEAFDFSGFDTVISSSVIFSKGIIVRPSTRHICYCYSPTRMLWDRNAQYERAGLASNIYRHLLRSWDQTAAQRPDQMIAISNTSAARISKYYRRSAMVIPPPTRQPCTADTSRVPQGEYYLVVARMVSHKELEMVVDAFAKLRYRLVIVGEGPLYAKIVGRATPNITCTGWVPDAQLDGLYAHCTAVIMPNEEDWGLTALEAMSHGKPVLALRRGGAVESILEGITGEFFDDAIPEALADGMKRIRASLQKYDSQAIELHASHYGEQQFRDRMQLLVSQSV